MENKLSKKQVANVIKVLKNGGKNRGALKNVQGTSEGWGITDGYQAYHFTTGTDNSGKIIKFDTLEVWYKLASAKDMLDLDTLENEEGYTMDLLRFFENASNDEKVDNLYLNAALLNTAQLICGTDFIDIKISGKGLTFLINIDENVKGLVLGARRNV